ncbi:MAG: hypothetical protein QXR73_01730 [Candidatus Micrarchaeaceae archaeon]
MSKAAKSIKKHNTSQRPAIVVLKSEGASTRVSLKDMRAREEMAAQLRAFGGDSLRYIRNFMPQVGCPNRCTFCSQNSAKTVVRLSDRDLKNVVSAIKTVAIEAIGRSPGITSNHGSSLLNQSLIGNRLNKGKSAVYPYLDTDICSYPYLYNYIKYLHEDLLVPVIISTVGYSRLNKSIQAMHERIVRDFSHSIASITFSLTPYTYGWTQVAEHSGLYKRKDYNLDMANAIKTYAPLLKILGPGRKTFCIALRFRPEVFVSTDQIDEGYIKDHHFVHLGPHLIVGLKRRITPKISKVIGIHGRSPVFDKKPLPYILVTSDSMLVGDNWRNIASKLIATRNASDNKVSGTHVRKVSVYKCENSDGPYYAIDPTFKSDGRFEALHIYPRTEKRRVSGYNNAARPLMNEILKYKREHNIHRRGKFPAATWKDVESVLSRLSRNAEEIGRYDSLHKKHTVDEIIPLVSSYVEILKLSGLDPKMFFHPHFTDDTGQIVNRGRAITQFRGLAATVDAHMTPNEVRTFDEVLHSRPGADYRLSPEPANENLNHKQRKINGKSSSTECMLSLAPIDYNPTFRHTKANSVLQINNIKMERISVEQFYEMQMLPGISPEPHRSSFAVAKTRPSRGRRSNSLR